MSHQPNEELLEQYEKARENHAQKLKESTAAETATQVAWDEMNAARIAVFEAQFPEIAERVKAINASRDSMDAEEREIREKMATDHGINLPPYYFKK